METPRRPSTRILIVEDEIIIAEDLEVRLKRMGYQVTGKATSGEEALRMISADEPDLVLLDVVLNGKIDGIDAAWEIREKYNCPFIFLTAYADDEKLDRAKKTMPFGYLIKPFADWDLKVTIERVAYMAENLPFHLKNKAEKKYGTVSDDNPVPTMLWRLTDGDLSLRDVNKAAKTQAWRYNGRPGRTDLSGKSFFPAELTDLARKCIESRSPMHREFACKKESNGHDAHYLAACCFLSPDQSLMHVWDVSDRVNGERRTMRPDARCPLPAEQIPAYLLEINPEGNIVYINKAIHPFSREEVIGTSIYRYLPRLDRGHFGDLMKRVFQSGSEESGKIRYALKNGDAVLFDFRIGPVIRNGEVKSLAVSLHGATGGFDPADRAGA